MITEAQREWQELVERIEALHDEAWSIQTRKARQNDIWLEIQRCRRRISDLAQAGVIFVPKEDSQT